MYLAIIVLPLLGSIVSGFFGRKVGISGSHLITCGSVIITTLLALITFFEVGFNNISVSLDIFKWMDTEYLNIGWSFNFDSLTVSMLIPVLIVSSLVHVYSIGYMSHDPHNPRFFSYLSLFTFMMVMLVTANNYLLMFVGWEGVGICSYLLVNFWFTRIAANQSSISAFLTNRVGDCFLTIGMFAILWSFGNIDYSTVFMLTPFMNENLVTITGICLLIGAMAKSSQVGLHIWLPMAMEGPTPVSALIHAATMVTAGVYLLMRSSPLIEYSSTVLLLCLWLGAITTVFSSLIGLFQQDIKKVIAYSTMSQLGMMVIAVGLSSYNVALFHLVNHAFYKALLFLGAGAVIHSVSDNQDFRKYGGLKQFLPLTYSVMLIASLSLVAFPFMTGFYSKDFILESAYGQFCFTSIAVYYIAVIGAMFTTLYSVKVLYLTFIANPNGPIVNYKNAHEGGLFMSLPLVILAIFSIYFGFLTKDIFLGLGTSFFLDNGVFIHPNNEIMIDTEFAVSTKYKLLPLCITILCSLIAIVLFEFYPKLLILFKFTKIGYNFFSFFNQRFFVELLYNKYITFFTLKLGGHTTKILDKGSVELLGPYGLEKSFLNISKSLSSLDTGVVTSYALYILIAFISYISVIYLEINNNLLLLVVTGLFYTLNTVVLLEINTSSVSVKESNVISLKTVLHKLKQKYTSKKLWIKIIFTSIFILVSKYILVKISSIEYKDFYDFNCLVPYMYWPCVSFMGLSSQLILDILFPETFPSSINTSESSGSSSGSGEPEESRSEKGSGARKSGSEEKSSISASSSGSSSDSSDAEASSSASAEKASAEASAEKASEEKATPPTWTAGQMQTWLNFNAAEVRSKRFPSHPMCFVPEGEARWSDGVASATDVVPGKGIVPGIGPATGYSPNTGISSEDEKFLYNLEKRRFSKDIDPRIIKLLDARERRDYAAKAARNYFFDSPGISKSQYAASVGISQAEAYENYNEARDALKELWKDPDLQKHCKDYCEKVLQTEKEEKEKERIESLRRKIRAENRAIQEEKDRRDLEDTSTPKGFDKWWKEFSAGVEEAKRWESMDEEERTYYLRKEIVRKRMKEEDEALKKSRK